MTKKHIHRIDMEGMAHHAHEKKGYDTWKIATVVLAVLFVVSLFTGGFSALPGRGDLPEKKATENALAFINSNLLQGQAVATSGGISELKGSDCLYNLTLEIQGNTFESYITKDGAFLFPQAINMKAAPAAAAADQSDQQASAEIPKTDRPEVLLFTMSYCPYGNQAEEGIVPVVKALGSSVEIQPHYVIYSNYRGGGEDYCLDVDNKYCSMHGINELNQDVRELCIYKYNKAKFWDYVINVNSNCNVGNIETCWEAPAKAAGIDTAKIKACQKDEALMLLAKEAELNTKYGVQGSPMLIINGAEYSGGRTPESYKTSICSAFNTQPSACSNTLSSDGAAATGDCG